MVLFKDSFNNAIGSGLFNKALNNCKVGGEGDNETTYILTEDLTALLNYGNVSDISGNEYDLKIDYTNEVVKKAIELGKMEPEVITINDALLNEVSSLFKKGKLAVNVFFQHGNLLLLIGFLAGIDKNSIWLWPEGAPGSDGAKGYDSLWKKDVSSFERERGSLNKLLHDPDYRPLIGYLNLPFTIHKERDGTSSTKDSEESVVFSSGIVHEQHDKKNLSEVCYCSTSVTLPQLNKFALMMLVSSIKEKSKNGV